MKRLCIILSVLFLAIAACKKASGPADGNSVQVNNNIDSTVSMNATINGQAWQTDSAFAYFIKTSGNDSLQTGLMINAQQGTGDSTKTINFYITNFTGAGTYLVNPPNTTATYYLGTTRNFGTSGQIVITVQTIVVNSDTGYALLGTFNFVAGADTINAGVFNVAMP